MVETYTAPKGPFQCKRFQRFGHTQRNCGYTPQCVACGETHHSGKCSTSKEQLQCCGCGGNHTANYRGCGKWNEAKAALARRAPTEPVSEAVGQHAVDSWERTPRGPHQWRWSNSRHTCQCLPHRQFPG
jgi:hypothetical protein